MPFFNLDKVSKSQAEAAAENVRMFVGDGGPVLRVPGLKSLVGVRIGGVRVPLEIEIEYPNSLAERDYTKEKVPLFQVEEMDGDTVLLRNTISNDGLFQEKERFFIDAEWADEAPAAEAAPVAEKPAKDAK